MSRLYALITGSGPRQLEFDSGLWTRKIIRELIRREFGVRLSEVQVGRLLNKIGLSPQRPLYRAYQQDPERGEEWKKSAYPKIRKLAAEEGASIFFADEAGIRTGHHAGTTWAPVGQAPVVITAGERKSVNMISAISPRGELRFRVQEGKMNAGKFIDFLKALLDSVPEKIFLIVDGHPVHKAKKVSEFVKEKADGRLSIFFLPPYSPDLDPGIDGPADWVGAIVLHGDFTGHHVQDVMAYYPSGPHAGTGVIIAGNGNVTSLEPAYGHTIPVNQPIAPAIDLWFKTTKAGGVIVSTRSSPISSGSTTGGGYNPILYIGSDGLLQAKFWNG